VYVKTRRSNTERELSNRVYEIKEAKGSHGGADPNICKDFVDMILDGKQPVATPIAGRMSVAVGCAATESIRSGGKVVQVTQAPDLAAELTGSGQ
ncbi:MAG: gfo/Idh/MocA family oxidoreductase, partial [Paenibacillus sp.]|nr:gfo/Idh/MocA family oxidoreductase [Paenibacillus sp.]